MKKMCDWKIVLFSSAAKVGQVIKNMHEVKKLGFWSYRIVGIYIYIYIYIYNALKNCLSFDLEQKWQTLTYRKINVFSGFLIKLRAEKAMEQEKYANLHIGWGINLQIRISHGILFTAVSMVVQYKVCTMYLPSYHPLKNFNILEKATHLLVNKLTRAAFSDILANSR